MTQVGTDRIIEIQFSNGQYKLFFEFYAAGNIILTDDDLNILALLRNVSEGAEHEQVRQGLQYNLSMRQNHGGVPPLTQERLEEGLSRAVKKQQDAAATATSTKRKVKPGDALRKALAVSIPEFPPTVLDHAFCLLGFDSKLNPEEVLGSESLSIQVLQALREAEKVINSITTVDVVKGYIIAKKRSRKGVVKDRTEAPSDSILKDESNLMYEDYHPFKPRQFEDDPECTVLEFEGFNRTVDEFYSSIEGQKLEARLQDREDTAKKRLDHARQEHTKRIAGLQQVQELHVRKAQAIEANLERVEEAATAINSLIAQGMDWVEIDRMVDLEQKRHNPVAQMIKLPLKLYENTATLLLSEPKDEEEYDDFEGDDTESDPSDSEDEDRTTKPSKPAKPVKKRIEVDIDLSISAWAMASQYYDQKKTAAVKEGKTMQASSKALKSTERKIAADLKKGLRQEKEILRPVRRQFWFEKFFYFISSDGYLVLGCVRSGYVGCLFC